jgi:hypothetical protein
MASYHPLMVGKFGLDILAESHVEIYIVLQVVALRAGYLVITHTF